MIVFCKKLHMRLFTFFSAILKQPRFDQFVRFSRSIICSIDILKANAKNSEKTDGEKYDNF